MAGLSKIFVVDFGSQTAHLIARRLKDLGIESSLVDPDDALKFVKKIKPKGLILSGGPSSVYEKKAPSINKKIFDLGIPILGICYGQQLTAHLLKGGKTVKDKVREDGPATLVIDKECVLFEGVSAHSRVWMSHGDTVVKAPLGFEMVAHSETIPSAAIKNDSKKIYGVQFHPEVEHTEHGTIILRNFVERVCKLKIGKRSISIPTIINSIREIVGDEKVIAAVSGGVDSTVSAALVAAAIGKKLNVVYADNGLMRAGTREEVEDIFRKKLHIDLRVIDCRRQFLAALKGVTDPEEKRKIIGRLYIELFEKEAKKLKDVKFLVQGTIYSDVIESKGSKHADKIKSHHNVGGLPENLGLTLLEPVRDFYKDEVRLIGKKLGLPDSIIYKQPLPGPGQAIRIIGEVTKERLDRQQKADQIILEEIRKAGLYRKIFQSFPVMTGVNSTAVKGDGRFYGEVVALRIYDSSDIMSASWSRLSYELLQKIVSRITNEVPGVSRVVYDITTKPPATMEWE
ncbi:MAG: glutamine-hydrolyzing GMP synthase [Patescibacteria group bacterium]